DVFYPEKLAGGLFRRHQYDHSISRQPALRHNRLHDFLLADPLDRREEKSSIRASTNRCGIPDSSMSGESEKTRFDGEILTASRQETCCPPSGLAEQLAEKVLGRLACLRHERFTQELDVLHAVEAKEAEVGA